MDAAPDRGERHRQLDRRDALPRRDDGVPAEPAARLIANPQVSGRDDGHDLNYRTLQALGVELLGHLAGIMDAAAYFAPDLAESVAFGDARYGDLCDLIRRSCRNAPDMPPPPPFVCDPPSSVPLSDLGTIIFTSGYRPDYERWIAFPGAFDDMGFPIQVDGSSTVVPGLHFMGVHFQRKRKSATFLGVAEDAMVLAENLRTGQDRRANRPF